MTLEPIACSCCGLVPADFGERTWCLCEPLPEGAVCIGEPHECTAARREHRHAFTQLIAEETREGVHVATIFRCACGQGRRLQMDTAA